MCGFYVILKLICDFSVNNINQLIFVMETCCDYVEHETEFLNNYLHKFRGSKGSFKANANVGRGRNNKTKYVE
jgi:hypothetical protein